MPRHQLGHRVDALGIDVAGDVAVVATDVVLLRRRAVQQAAGLQVELPRRGCSPAVRRGAGRAGNPAPGSRRRPVRRKARNAVAGRRQRQDAQGKRGIQRRLALRQGPQALVQRIDQSVGLAQPRAAHANRALDGLQQVIDCGVDGTGSAQDDALRRMGSRKFGPCLPAGRSASGKNPHRGYEKAAGRRLSRHCPGVVTDRTYA